MMISAVIYSDACTVLTECESLCVCVLPVPTCYQTIERSSSRVCAIVQEHASAAWTSVAAQVEQLEARGVTLPRAQSGLLEQHGAKVSRANARGEPKRPSEMTSRRLPNEALVIGLC